MALILAHPMISLIVGYYLLNALAAGMPAPTTASGIAYRWSYGSLHALAMNFLELARARYPQASLPAVPIALIPAPSANQGDHPCDSSQT